MSEIEHVVSCRNMHGEGPLWDPAARALFWLDMHGANIWKFVPATGRTEVFEPGEMVTCIGMRSGGGWVATTEKHFAFLDLEHGRLEKIIALEGGKPKARFNDGAVDRQGRFWAGTMTTEYGESSSLYRLDPDLTVRTLETGITISNGIGWSPDNQKMYFTDSARRHINAYDFDPETGSLANKQLLIQTPEGEGEPDGLTVDAEGYIWSARWDGWKVCRYTPEGDLDREILVPVQFPSSVMFGGENLDELYITSSRIAIAEENQARQPMAGDIFRVRPGVRGLAEPFFGG